ncbi:MAG TPA: aminopeptidase [Polyangiales bacterium]|nr:aminopeptidase [Polyangiales bacterium]
MARKVPCVLACAVLGLLLAGCSLVELAGGQLAIIDDQRPLPRAIADERDPERRALLAEVPEARRYAEQVLALDAGKSYTGYYATEREGMTYVVTACERFRFEAYTWWFPIVGSVEYRSYAEAEEAEAAAAELEARGYDTWVAPSRAYSTLGFFRDPISTTMLRDSLPGLVEVIFHELAHVRLYVPGRTEWNEALATFVGETGAEQYFARARFRGTPWPAEMTERTRKKRELDVLVAGAYDDLARAYASGASPASLAAHRTRVFSALTRALTRLHPSHDRKHWAMNNARLMHLRRYSASADQFVKLWEQSGQRWRVFWQLVQAHAHEQ